MPKKIDLTGKIFGKLTVIEEAPKRGNVIYWKCKCECGKITEIAGSALRSGHTKSCGCYKPYKKNLIGQHFGELTVIKETEERDKSGTIMWECQCSCGNIIKVSTNHLTTGNTQSCGCIRKMKLIEYNNQRIIDITGKKFGLLTVLYPLEERTNDKQVVWHCLCDCGNYTDVPGYDLRSGNTKSCGCQRNNSYGERKIEEILKENDISYMREYTPKTLSFKGRFDFYIPAYNTMIEYDGQQHTIAGNGHFDNPDKIKITQEHDEIKNQWCKDNNIILIRIPYTHYNNICINDLLPETSNFIRRIE